MAFFKKQKQDKVEIPATEIPSMESEQEFPITHNQTLAEVIEEVRKDMEAKPEQEIPSMESTEQDKYLEELEQDVYTLQDTQELPEIDLNDDYTAEEIAEFDQEAWDSIMGEYDTELDYNTELDDYDIPISELDDDEIPFDEDAFNDFLEDLDKVDPKKKLKIVETKKGYTVAFPEVKNWSSYDIGQTLMEIIYERFLKEDYNVKNEYGRISYEFFDHKDVDITSKSKNDLIKTYTADVSLPIIQLEEDNMLLYTVGFPRIDNMLRALVKTIKDFNIEEYLNEYVKETEEKAIEEELARKIQIAAEYKEKVNAQIDLYNTYKQNEEVRRVSNKVRMALSNQQGLSNNVKVEEEFNCNELSINLMLENEPTVSTRLVTIDIDKGITYIKVNDDMLSIVKSAINENYLIVEELPYNDGISYVVIERN